MIPMKEARVNLYKMYKDKYVTYQEVPRRDHNPETTLFLWGINNLGGKNNVVVDDAHKTLLNLRLRREAEVAKHRDVIVGLDESLADEVEVARQFRFILEHLDKAILDMARMLRLFNA
jgi:D-aminopeptidase